MEKDAVEEFSHQIMYGSTRNIDLYWISHGRQLQLFVISYLGLEAVLARVGWQSHCGIVLKTLVLTITDAHGMVLRFQDQSQHR